MSTQPTRVHQILCTTVWVACASVALQAQAFDVAFSESADALNLTHFGQTHGQSWGDFNRDGYADLYVSYHGEGIAVFRNEAGLGFTNINDLISADMTGDIHSAAWGDFDNDGDPGSSFC